MSTVPGHWTNSQELIDSVPYSPENIAAYRVGARTTDRRYRDIPVGDTGEEVAVAVLNEEGAFAFSSTSYEHNAFGDPDLRLSRGTYRVVVHARGSSVNHKRVFKLEYLSEKFDQFQLQEI